MRVTSSKRSDRGITLVALIITIIILVILTAVSIVAVYKSRVVDYAINGATGYASESIRENEIMSGTESLLDSTINRIEDIVTGKTPEPPKELAKGPNGKTLATELTNIQGTEVKAEDRLGNNITVPAGFKYKEGEIAEKGIVIEDGAGNEFVWVPVSNINHDGTNKIKRENGLDVEITLGRYQFDTGTGAVKKGDGEYQYAANYAAETPFGNYKELKEYRESNRQKDLTGTNTTAKDLAGFINSTASNHGYYIARYEASYGSGYDNTKENPLENAKPLSKVSTANSDSSMDYTTAGTLWNNITEPDAAKVCRNMYSSNVNSDLVNSYAWDTAIVFMQEMEDNDYSIKADGNGTLRDTGTTGDKACNIYDIGGNLREWTTEYSSITAGKLAFPCTVIGGASGNSDICTSTHGNGSALESHGYVGFRCLLYV